MKDNRREFLKKAAIGGIGALGVQSKLFGGQSVESIKPVNGKILTIKPSDIHYFKPLQEITVTGATDGTIVVKDGAGTEYIRKSATSKFSFKAAGVLGFHQISLQDKKGHIIDVASVPVNCQTEIKDENGKWERFFNMLYFTMTNTGYNAGHIKRMNGKNYKYFSSWFQDHVYAMLGMRYFEPELKSGVDLYTDGQREDGMIHDNYKHKWEIGGAWSRRFDYGNFVTIPEDENSSCVFVRVPVENMAEFTYLEGIYLTWKATGDDVWMKSKLDSMLKALNYTMTDPYRWSKKFDLTKRGYTIDIWDFQSDEDSARAGNDTMRVYLDKSKFSVMYGDNVRLAESCRYLSIMLSYAGRNEEAEKVKKIGKGIKERIDKLAWNGEFYTHHIHEDPTVKRDFGGTDETKQVTLSNAWVLNRGVTHEQAVGIIKTYQRILNEMPNTSPGEWYCCYPPYEKGWSAKKWNYMNGGVTPIGAGEIALGAFEHGFEDYAVDILERVDKLAEKTNYQLEGCYKGAIEPEPERTFTKLDLSKVANADIVGTGAKGVPGWTNEGDNDLHEFPVGEQTFKRIPFLITDPSKNGRKCVLALSGDPLYKRHAEIPVNQKAGSLYFLHVMGAGSLAGNVTFNYQDGTQVTKYISALQAKGVPASIGNWWTPYAPESNGAMTKLHVAWTGKNNHTPKLGVFIYGMDNPEPEKIISKLEFEGQKDDSKWMILGLTLSDAKVYFEPYLVSSIPAHWAAAECMFGLMEGLVGIKDSGVAFDKAILAPRWEAADVNTVSTTAKYVSSNGYLAYNYQKYGNTYSVEFTGSAKQTEVKLLIPKGKSVSGIELNGNSADFTIEKIESSEYALLTIEGIQANTIKMMVG